MVAVKAKYEDGKVELPPDFTGHKPCEVTVLFPEDAAPKRKLGDSEAFRRAAGSWRDMDCEAIKKMIYESRKDHGTRKPPRWPNT
ncbi:MAG TPA: hypothetical protein VNE39_14390 [Planctomycetota bacterium]|nr:hypothetical protein [Planctomycetota bacterium]